MADDAVKAWSERVTIPTYRIGEPDKNPMFLEKRVYQGSSGVVYPHPVIDRVFDEKYDREYTAVFLENRYLKIMILPEIGGRVQMALDKTNGYHFVYYNQVIKPALVGLTGPWISGGIEFNWPQHHRPSTFDPLDWRIDEHPDGARTVWCSEIERMFRTKGMHGFTLYPDRAYLEINVQLYNRTVRAADLPVVGQPGGARQRRLPVRLSARRPRGDGSRQARCLAFPDRDRHLLQGELRARHRHQPL